MNWAQLIFFFSFISSKCHASELLEKAPLVLGQGEQRLLEVQGLLRYSLGSGVVRGIAIPQKQDAGNSQEKHADHLLLKGILPGISDLWIWKKDGITEHRSLRVEAFKPVERNLNLEKALEKLNEVEIILSGKGVILHGTILSRAESTLVAYLLSHFPKEVFNQTQISALLLTDSQKELEKWIHSSKYSSQLRVERVGQTLWLRGHLERPSELPNIEKEAQVLFPLVQIEIDTLPDRAPTVYFRVFLLELQRSHYQSLGLAWPSSLPGAFQVTPSHLRSLVEMDLTLQQLEGEGGVKVLSNPELVVRAPGEAELFAGGELPIQVQNRFFSNVIWKNYGLTLRLKVTHTAGDLVRLEIFTEVSHLDRNVAQNSIPGIQANRMKTEVDARFGTPLLLSGLLQQNVRNEVKGLPFFKDIPVLGLLFGSQDYLNERSELVAILYPQSSPPVRSTESLPLLLPKGPIPPPRNWLTPENEQRIRAALNFPWNVLD